MFSEFRSKYLDPTTEVIKTFCFGRIIKTKPFERNTSVEVCFYLRLVVVPVKCGKIEKFNVTISARVEIGTNDYSIPAVPNLGYAYPRRYVRKLKWYAKISCIQY